MTSVQLRPVPTISTVRTAAAKPAGAVSACWDTCRSIRVSYQENRAWVQFCAIVGVLLTVLGLWLAHFATVMAGLLIVWAVMVVWAWRQKHADADGLTEDGLIATWSYPSRWLGRMLLGPVAVTLLVTWAWAQHALRWPLCELASVGSVFGIVLVLAVMERPDDTQPSRWEEETLRDAFLAAGAVKGGFTRLGPPQSDEHGEWQTLKLAPGEVWSDFAAKVPALASALDVEEDMLTVEHAGGPPNQVRVRITNKLDRDPTILQSVRSPLYEMGPTDWTEPLRIGYDPLTGEPVEIELFEQNTLLGAKPRSGKTSTARIPLTKAMWAPNSLLWGLDGKGSRKDYACLKPLCEDWVWGTDDDAPEHLADMLERIRQMVRARNAEENDVDRIWPGIFVLLEELQDVRAGATKDEGAVIDNAIGRIIRTGPAVGVHLLVSTQRPSGLDIPTGIRNLIGQNLCGMVRSPEDAKLTLGTTPRGIDLPARKGEGILATQERIRPVVLDFMDLPDFRANCARALAWRNSKVQATAVDKVKPEREVITIRQPRTLVSVVTEALQGGPMLASALYEVVRAAELPESAIPATSSAMGRLLGKRPEFASRRTATGSIWSLAAVTNGARMASDRPVLSVNGGHDAFPSSDNGPAVEAGVRR